MCMVNRYDDGHCDFLQSQTPTNNNELVESLIRGHNDPAQQKSDSEVQCVRLNLQVLEDIHTHFTCCLLPTYAYCFTCVDALNRGQRQNAITHYSIFIYFV